MIFLFREFYVFIYFFQIFQENLFDEINADIPSKLGPSFAKTVFIIPQEKDAQSSSSEKPKIEFELKDGGKTTSSEFSDFMSKEKDEKAFSGRKTSKEPLKNELLVEKTIHEDNVYLQVTFSTSLIRFISKLIG